MKKLFYPLVKNPFSEKDILEGIKVLKALINNNETPEYLKGLARSELSTLALKNKTL